MRFEQRLEGDKGVGHVVIGGRALPAEGTASAKALRWEHAWWDPGAARRMVCLEQNEWRGGEEKGALHMARVP